MEYGKITAKQREILEYLKNQIINIRFLLIFIDLTCVYVLKL